MKANEARKPGVIRISSKAAMLIDVLNKAGYEAYVVGGCVRDCLLGKTPHDWDITTSATPEEVKSLFSRTIDTGLKHGTVTVMVEKEGFEITTYRVDGEYEDGRHPKEVVFTRNLAEDLKRRDFTMNAMAYNPSEGLVDLFEGELDLRRGIIRCVGDPEERFSEDALRMLRAVRFSAQLGFAIDEETRAAVRHLAPALSKVSAERIQSEISKILLSAHPDWFREVYELGLSAVFIPEFDRCMTCSQNTPFHCYTVGEHILHSMSCIPARLELRLAMLLHDIAKPEMKTTDENGIDHFKMHAVRGEKTARDIMRRLKYDNQTTDYVCRLVLWHDCRPKPNAGSVRKAMNKMGPDLFEDYMVVQKADMLAQSSYLRKEKEERMEGVAAVYREILERHEAVQISDLAAGGKDLIGAGIAPGPQMGEILRYLLERVLEEPELNTKAALIALAKERLAKESTQTT